jgi:O-antigen ligase
LALIKAGLVIVQDTPIIGTGIGDEMHALEEKLPLFDETIAVPVKRLLKYNFHNAYMQYLVQLGIIGLFLYLLIFYEIIKLKINNRELSNVRYIFVAVFCISSLVELMFAAQFSLAFFALFVGIFIGFSQFEEEEFPVKN